MKIRAILKGIGIGVLAILAIVVAIVGFVLSAVMGIAVSLAAIGAPFCLAIVMAVHDWVTRKKEK
jgi:hypothetical protein